MVQVKGKLVDDQTRCVHYKSQLDIIAIKFKCCDTYYPCFTCHLESTDHEAQAWPSNELAIKAILCGVCKTEITIESYLESDNHCPNCNAPFNPKCKLHYHLYFDV